MTVQLFRFEVRRMLRHPMLWGGTALILAVQVYLSWGEQPDLTVDTVRATGFAACLAGAVLVVSSLAVSRDGRHRMPESLGGLPGRSRARTAAVLAAAVLAGVLAETVFMGGYLLVRLASGPVGGRLDVFEPLTGLALGALGGALGASVGRWARRLIAGPVVMAGLGLLIFLNVTPGPGSWWSPVVQQHWMDWPDRPSGPHLLYVLALAGLAGALALLRHGLRPVAAVAAVAGLAVAVPAGATAAAVPPVTPLHAGRFDLSDVDQRVRERYFGADARRCEQHDGVRYCAFPEYVPWIPLWAEAVAPVARAVPPERRGLVPRVEQATSSWIISMDSGVAYAPMAWGRPDQRTALAQSVAFDVAGFDSQCDARGQARMVVALWLWGQGSGIGLPTMLRMDEHLGVTPGSEWGDTEVRYARLMLRTAGIRERIWAHWDTLMRPATTTEQALPLLGLSQQYPVSKPKGAPCR
ncbi:hypothetical protein ABT294_35820 [Nonomuraea sp. NPDC000554]|uniref:hypothetical protein n=1 Tax=Nonomuraea sp. NPDC000554 TaxID=3154259 RepID=UPI0033312B53